MREKRGREKKKEKKKERERERETERDKKLARRSLPESNPGFFPRATKIAIF